MVHTFSRYFLLAAAWMLLPVAAVAARMAMELVEAVLVLATAAAGSSTAATVLPI